MKTFFATVALLGISFIGVAQSLTVEYYPSGKKRGEGVASAATQSKTSEIKKERARRTSNVVKDGKWTYWFEDGTVNSEEFYNQGVRTGIWKIWYSTGKLQQEINFSNGKTKNYYENGQLLNEGKMTIEMVTVGKWTGYYPNGNKNYEGSYDDKGMKTGTWKWYKETGEALGVQEYESGKLISK